MVRGVQPIELEVAHLSPVRFAALVAPALSRAFTSGMAPTEEARRLVASYGRPAVGYLIDLRNPLASGRSVGAGDLAVLYRYDDPGELAATMLGSVSAGLLDTDDHGGYRATERGHEFLTALFTAQGRALDERWGTRADLVARLVTTTGRLLAAATETGGAAFAIQSPPYEPEDAPPALVLLNRLSTLRYHRADAHAAAWQEAGLTADQVAAEPWGKPWSQQRHQVEAATNRRAAQPYAVLDPDERLTLLADLAALP